MATGAAAGTLRRATEDLEELVDGRRVVDRLVVAGRLIVAGRLVVTVRTYQRDDAGLPDHEVPAGKDRDAHVVELRAG